MITRTLPFPRLIASMLAGALAISAMACSSTSSPSMTAATPVSPAAAEGARLPRQEYLQPDSASRKTAALLSAAEKETEHAEAGSSAAGTSTQSPK
jgi:hypothetical protein